MICLFSLLFKFYSQGSQNFQQEFCRSHHRFYGVIRLVNSVCSVITEISAENFSTVFSIIFHRSQNFQRTFHTDHTIIKDHTIITDHRILSRSQMLQQNIMLPFRKVQITEHTAIGSLHIYIYITHSS